MNESKHQELLDYFKASIYDAADKIVTGDETKASFKDIQFNDSLNSYTVIVNKDNYNSWAALNLFDINIDILMYQQIKGVPFKDISISYNIIDAETGVEICSV